MWNVAGMFAGDTLAVLSILQVPNESVNSDKGRRRGQLLCLHVGRVETCDKPPCGMFVHGQLGYFKPASLACFRYCTFLLWHPEKLIITSSNGMYKGMPRGSPLNSLEKEKNKFCMILQNWKFLMYHLSKISGIVLA